MSFFTALTGLKAATSALGVTSNNIANAGTVGFKRSRTDFGDIFATSPLQNASTTIGQGVALKQVTQQFSQGNVAFSANTLDLAITGDGFFPLKSPDGLQSIYTRNGSFMMNDQYNVVNSSGQRLLAASVDSSGKANLDELSVLTIPQKTSGQARETSLIQLGLNFPADAKVVGGDFDRNDPTTYNKSTALTVYDAGGNSYLATVYYVKTQNASQASPTNKWQTYVYVGETLVGAALQQATNSSGEKLYVNQYGQLEPESKVSDQLVNAKTMSFHLDDLTDVRTSTPATVTGGTASNLGTLPGEGVNFSQYNAHQLTDMFTIDVDDTGTPVSIGLEHLAGKNVTLSGAQIAQELTNVINQKLGDGKYFNFTSNPTFKVVTTDPNTGVTLSTKTINLGSLTDTNGVSVLKNTTAADYPNFPSMTSEEVSKLINDQLYTADNSKVVIENSSGVGANFGGFTLKYTTPGNPGYSHPIVLGSSASFLKASSLTDMATKLQADLNNSSLNTYTETQGNNQVVVSFSDNRFSVKVADNGLDLIITDKQGGTITKSGTGFNATSTLPNGAVQLVSPLTSGTYFKGFNLVYTDGNTAQAIQLDDTASFLDATSLSDMATKLETDLNTDPSLGNTSEAASVQFVALTAGQFVELGGLKFTAGANGATADEVAAAFANLAEGATTGPGTAKGSYTGTLNGYATGAANNADQVVFTSTAVGDITDLAESQGSTVGAITVTDGGAGVTFEVTVSGTNLVITPSTGVTVVASGTDFVSGVTYPRGTVSTPSSAVTTQYDPVSQQFVFAPPTGATMSLTGGPNLLMGMSSASLTQDPNLTTLSATSYPQGAYIRDAKLQRFGMTVTYDSVNQNFVFTSGTSGDMSSISVVPTTDIENLALTKLGLVESTPAGIPINYSVETTATALRGLASNPAVMTGTPIGINVNNTFSVDVSNNKFVVSVDNVQGTVVLEPKSNYTLDTFIQALEDGINRLTGPSAGAGLTGPSVSGVKVSYDGATNSLKFTTGTSGEDSFIKVTGDALWGLSSVQAGRGATSTWIKPTQFTQVANGVPVAQYIDKYGNETASADGFTALPAWSPVYLDRGELTFNTAGGLISPTTGSKLDTIYLPDGKGSLSINIDYSKSTQYTSPFAVLSQSQDGAPEGDLVGLSIADDGLVNASYSNGTQQSLGKIVLANFSNPAGLRQIGNSSFYASYASGSAKIGEAGSAGFGTVRSGATESANVDLTAELVDLITEQRNFQASAKAIETDATLTQTIIQIRA